MPSRAGWPIWPGCSRAAACRWESSGRPRPLRATSMRCRTCWRWRWPNGRRPAAPHGMQVTVATRLALRVWQLVDSTISSGAQIRVPDESSRRDATELAFAELGAKTVEECWTGYSAKRNWLLAHQADVEAMVADWDGFKQTVTLPTPEQFDEVSHASGLPTRARDLGAGLRRRSAVLGAAQFPPTARTDFDRRSRRSARRLVRRHGAVHRGRRRKRMKED